MWAPPGNNHKGAHLTVLLQCADFCSEEQACHRFLISPDYGPVFDIIDLRPLKYHLSYRFALVIRTRQLRSQRAPSSWGARGTTLLNSGPTNSRQPHAAFSSHTQMRQLSQIPSPHLAFHLLTQKSSFSGLQQTSSALSSLAVQGASSVCCFPLSVSLLSFKEDAVEAQRSQDLSRTAQGSRGQRQRTGYDQTSHF